MTQEKQNPNEVYLVVSKESWHCSQTVDFTTPEGVELLRKIQSPEGVRYFLQAAFGNCWLELPESNKNLAILRREMRRLVELTTENLYARPQAFGIGGEPPDERTAEFRDARFRGDPMLLMLHSAVEICHEMLPADERTVRTVAREFHALFEQSLTDVRIGTTGFIEWA